jgi:hypothetical protein
MSPIVASASSGSNGRRSRAGTRMAGASVIARTSLAGSP